MTGRAESHVKFIVVFVTALVIGAPASGANQCADLFYSSLKSVSSPASHQDLMQSWSIANFPLTIGVELEGHIPNGVSFREIAHRVVEHINDHFPDRQLELEKSWLDQRTGPLYGEFYYDKTFIPWGGPYSNSHYFDSNDYIIHDDGSIERVEGKHSLEIGSPVLSSADDLKAFVMSLQYLSETNVYTPHESAGLHVHVGMPEPQPSEVMRLARLFTAVQDEAYRHFQVIEKRKDRYARPLPQNHWKVLQNRIERGADLNELSVVFERKYHGLNLNSLVDGRRTVEFRLFNSTENIDEIYLAVAFSVVLVEQARTQGPLVRMLLSEEPSEELGKRLFHEALRLAEEWLRDSGWTPSDTSTSHPIQHRSSVLRSVPEMERRAFSRTG